MDGQSLLITDILTDRLMDRHGDIETRVNTHFYNTIFRHFKAFGVDQNVFNTPLERFTTDSPA